MPTPRSRSVRSSVQSSPARSPALSVGSKSSRPPRLFQDVSPSRQGPRSSRRRPSLVPSLRMPLQSVDAVSEEYTPRSTGDLYMRPHGSQTPQQLESLRIEGELWLITPQTGPGKKKCKSPQWVVCEDQRVSVYSTWSGAGRLVQEMSYERVRIAFNFSHVHKHKDESQGGPQTRKLSRPDSASRVRGSPSHGGFVARSPMASPVIGSYYYFGVEGLSPDPLTGVNRRSLIIFCTDRKDDYRVWMEFWSDMSARYPMVRTRPVGETPRSGTPSTDTSAEYVPWGETFIFPHPRRPVSTVLPVIDDSPNPTSSDAVIKDPGSATMPAATAPGAGSSAVPGTVTLFKEKGEDDEYDMDVSLCLRSATAKGGHFKSPDPDGGSSRILEVERALRDSIEEAEGHIRSLLEAVPFVDNSNTAKHALAAKADAEEGEDPLATIARLQNDVRQLTAELAESREALLAAPTSRGDVGDAAQPGDAPRHELDEELAALKAENEKLHRLLASSPTSSSEARKQRPSDAFLSSHGNVLEEHLAVLAEPLSEEGFSSRDNGSKDDATLHVGDPTLPLRVLQAIAGAFKAGEPATTDTDNNTNNSAECDPSRGIATVMARWRDSLARSVDRSHPSNNNHRNNDSLSESDAQLVDQVFGAATGVYDLVCDAETLQRFIAKLYAASSSDAFVDTDPSAIVSAPTDALAHFHSVHTTEERMAALEARVEHAKRLHVEASAELEALRGSLMQLVGRPVVGEEERTLEDLTALLQQCRPADFESSSKEDQQQQQQQLCSAAAAHVARADLVSTCTPDALLSEAQSLLGTTSIPAALSHCWALPLSRVHFGPHGSDAHCDDESSLPLPGEDISSSIGALVALVKTQRNDLDTLFEGRHQLAEIIESLAEKKSEAAGAPTLNVAPSQLAALRAQEKDLEQQIRVRRHPVLSSSSPDNAAAAASPLVGLQDQLDQVQLEIDTLLRCPMAVEAPPPAEASWTPSLVALLALMEEEYVERIQIVVAYAFGAWFALGTGGEDVSSPLVADDSRDGPVSTLSRVAVRQQEAIQFLSTAMAEAEWYVLSPDEMQSPERSRRDPVRRLRYLTDRMHARRVDARARQRSTAEWLATVAGADYLEKFKELQSDAERADARMMIAVANYVDDFLVVLEGDGWPAIIAEHSQELEEAFRADVAECLAVATAVVSGVRMSAGELLVHLPSADTPSVSVAHKSTSSMSNNQMRARMVLCPFNRVLALYRKYRPPTYTDMGIPVICEGAAAMECQRQLVEALTDQHNAHERLGDFIDDVMQNLWQEGPSALPSPLLERAETMLEAHRPLNALTTSVDTSSPIDARILNLSELLCNSFFTDADAAELQRVLKENADLIPSSTFHTLAEPDAVHPFTPAELVQFINAIATRRAALEEQTTAFREAIIDVLQVQDQPHFRSTAATYDRSREALTNATIPLLPHCYIPFTATPSQSTTEIPLDILQAQQTIAPLYTEHKNNNDNTVPLLCILLRKLQPLNDNTALSKEDVAGLYNRLEDAEKALAAHADGLHDLGDALNDDEHASADADEERPATPTIESLLDRVAALKAERDDAIAAASDLRDAVEEAVGVPGDNDIQELADAVAAARAELEKELEEAAALPTSPSKKAAARRAAAKRGELEELERELEAATAAATDEAEVPSPEYVAGVKDRLGALAAHDDRLLLSSDTQPQITSTHTKSFDGEDWDIVVENKPEALHTAIENDASSACHVMPWNVSAIVHTLGSLHIEFAITHNADILPEEMSWRVSEYEFPRVLALYERRHSPKDGLDRAKDDLAAQREELDALKNALDDALAAAADAAEGENDEVAGLCKKLEDAEKALAAHADGLHDLGDALNDEPPTFIADEERPATPTIESLLDRVVTLKAERDNAISSGVDPVHVGHEVAKAGKGDASPIGPDDKGTLQSGLPHSPTFGEGKTGSPNVVLDDRASVKGLRDAVNLALSILGGNSSAGGIDKALQDVKDRVAEVQQLLAVDSKDEAENVKARMDRIIAAVKAMTSGGTTKGAEKALYALVHEDWNQADSISFSTQRRLSSKEKPITPEVARNDAFYLSKMLLEKRPPSLVAYGTSPRLASASMDDVMKYKQDLHDKMAELEVLHRGIVIAMELNGDRDDYQTMEANTLVLHLIQHAKDVQDASSHMDELFEQCPDVLEERKGGDKMQPQEKVVDPSQASLSVKTSVLLRYIRKLRSANDALRLNISSLEQQQQFLLNNRENQALQDEVKGLDAACRQKEEELSRIQAELATRDNQLDEMSQKLQDGEAELKGVKNHVEMLQNERSDLKDEATQAADAIAALRVECTALSGQLADAKAQLAELDNTLNRRIAEEDALRQSCRQLRSQCKHVRRAARRFIDDDLDTTTKSATPLGVLEECQSILDDALGDAVKLVSEVNASQEALKAGTAELQLVKDQLVEAQRRCKALNAELAHAMEQQQQMQAKAHQMKLGLEAELAEQQRSADRRLQALRAEMQDDGTRHAALQKTKAELAAEKGLREAAEREVREVKHRVDAADGVLAGLRSALAEEESLREAAEKEARDAQETLAALHQSSRDAFDDVARELEGSVRAQAAMEKEVAALKSAMGTLQAEKRRADDAAGAARSDMAAAIAAARNQLVSAGLLKHEEDRAGATPIMHSSSGSSLPKMIGQAIEAHEDALSAERAAAEMHRKSTSAKCVSTATGPDTLLEALVAATSGLVPRGASLETLANIAVSAIAGSKELDRARDVLAMALEGDDSGIHGSSLPAMLELLLGRMSQTRQECDALMGEWQKAVHDANELRHELSTHIRENQDASLELELNIGQMRQMVHRKLEADEIAEKHASETQRAMEEHLAQLYGFATERAEMMQHVVQLKQLLREKRHIEAAQTQQQQQIL